MVEAERADATQVAFFAQAVMGLDGIRTRVVLGRGDDDYAMLSAGSSRSLAAALIHLADVVEGLRG